MDGIQHIEVIPHRGFTIEFHFPHYHVYYNKKAIWCDIGVRDCQVWINGLMDWLLEGYSVVDPEAKSHVKTDY